MTEPKIAFTHRSHSYSKWKQLPWMICDICGLVRLRNPITDWCDRHGCNNDDHPGYKRAIATLCKPP